MTSISSSKSDMEILAERISITALEALACRHGPSKHVEIQSSPMRGSFNLVYPISFPDGRKWVARIPAPESTDTLIMQSTIDTIGLIRQKTSIPIPAIHAYDFTSNNELGMPYVLMDFVNGIPLGRIWKDESLVNDATRARLFEQVASSMCQLSALEFDKIGHLHYDKDHGTYVVGPYRRLKFSLRSDVPTVEESGPFTTTHAYLSTLVQSLVNSPDHTKSIFCLLRLLALSLPDPQYDGAPFVLSHPDFDSQNVMVDPETFAVTGFIDWDGVHVGPRLGGFARYPAWITRDWDPFIYDWRDPDAEDSDSAEADGSDAEEVEDPQDHATKSEDTPEEPDADLSEHTGSKASSVVSNEESPDTLQRHRDLYLSIYSKMDPQNSDITRQSHIFEALSIALHSPELAADILGKLCSYVFDSEMVHWGSLLTGVEGGDWMKSLRSSQSTVS